MAKERYLIRAELEQKRAGKRARFFFGLMLWATLLAESYYSPKGHFEIEQLLYFNAWFGFGACAVIIVVSKMLGRFLKRGETYYTVEEDTA